MLVKYNHRTMGDDVIDLWNKIMVYDTITKKKFLKKIIFDENFDNDLCYVYIKNETIAGFILATKRKFPYLERGLEENKAWINIMFVKEEYQDKGIGTIMLTKVEETLKSKGVNTISLANYSPNYFLAGLDIEHYPKSKSFFEKHGYYMIDKHYSMGKIIHGYQISEKNIKRKESFEKEGYKFINFSYKYSLEVLDFLKEEFGGGWKYNALNAMKNDIAQDTICLVLNPKGEICGVSNRAIDGNDNRFGPIGISRYERNNGLGSVLLEYSLYEMSKRNIYYMFFMTTDEDAKRYYERLGLNLIRTYITYQKEL